MSNQKEKRIYERINLPNLSGSVELFETLKPISIINASEEGVCVSGADFPVGSVVRIEIDAPEENPNISLYAKVVWASRKKDPQKMSGLSFLNTNKVLFRKDLISFAKIIDTARKQAAI